MAPRSNLTKLFFSGSELGRPDEKDNVLYEFRILACEILACE
jgi:hypothetical protein